jgi:hypothetical protein
LRTDTAHDRFEDRDKGWFPARRRDNSFQDDARQLDRYVPPSRSSGGDVAQPHPLFLTATLAVPEAHALMQVTLALVGDGAPGHDPRAVLDVSGEVKGSEPQAVSPPLPLPVVLVGPVHVTRQGPISAIVARYLANAEPGQLTTYGRSVYA